MTTEQDIRDHAANAGIDLNVRDGQDPTTEQAAYLRLIAIEQARLDYEQDPVRIAAERIEDELAFPEWEPGHDYTEGDQVRHQGVRYVALADVSHSPPDDKWNPDDMTGGWMPA